jgi:predicted ArsR family transcriptional regulator
MAALTARNVHLTDQALALLADSPLPMSTREVARAVGITNVAREQEAWRVLDRLARRGLVERIRLPEASCRYWRYVGGDGR